MRILFHLHMRILHLYNYTQKENYFQKEIKFTSVSSFYLHTYKTREITNVNRYILYIRNEENYEIALIFHCPPLSPATFAATPPPSFYHDLSPFDPDIGSGSLKFIGPMVHRTFFSQPSAFPFFSPDTPFYPLS